MKKHIFKIFIICLIAIIGGVNGAFAVGSISGTPNIPVLANGMVPVKWLNNSWVVTDSTDVSWYDYSTGKWANIMLRDDLAVEGVTNANTATLASMIGKKVTSEGSMFVWIPRYKYKVAGTNMLIKFTSGINDETEDGYNKQPAFFLGSYIGGDSNNKSSYSERDNTNNELTGFWMGKYMASEESGRIQTKSNKTPSIARTIGSAFTETAGMTKKAQEVYGDLSFATSHLTKNSEWGAVAYLSIANGTLPTSNGTNKTSQAISNKSTTGNPYGVFDMNGLQREYVSSFIQVGNINSAAEANVGEMTKKANAIYVDKIELIDADVSAKNKARLGAYYGMATSEVEDVETANRVAPATSNPVFTRSGSGSTNSGVLAYEASNGGTNIAGFRPTIGIISSYMMGEMALFDTDASVMRGDYLVLSVDFNVENQWKFPLSGSQTLKDNIFDFVNLRLIRNNSSLEVKQEQLNQKLLGITYLTTDNSGAVTATDKSSLIDTVSASNNPTMLAGKYAFKVKIGGMISDGTTEGPVFFPIKGMTSKIVIDEIKLKNALTGKDMKVTGISKNKVTLSIYGTEEDVTTIGLLNEPTKKDYYLGEKLNLSGMQLEIKYGTLSSGIIDAEELVASEIVNNYDNVTSNPATSKKVELTYDGKNVLQGAEYKEFRINVSNEAPRDLSLEKKNGYSGAGSLSGSGTFFPGDTVYISATTNPGFKFKRWELKDGTVISTDAVASFKMPNNDLTAYAVYNGVTELIVKNPLRTEFELGDTYDLGGGSLYARFEDSTTSEITLGTEGVTSSNIVLGDQLNILGTQTVKITYGGINYTYEINVVKNKFSLTYLVESALEGEIKDTSTNAVIVPKSGENTAVVATSYDTEISITAVAKENYVFDGWEITKTGLVESDKLNQESITFIMPQETVVVKAKFSLKIYTIEYMAESGGYINGETTQTIMSGKAGSSVTAVPADTYVFGKWSDGLTTASRTETNVTSDKTYTATFTKTWTVIFTDSDGNVLGTETVKNGESATPPLSKVPVKAGFTFSGWSVPYTNVTENIVTAAQYTATEYTVTVTSEDTTKGTVNSVSGKYKAGERINILATPQERYQFTKWETAAGITIYESDKEASAFFYTITANVSIVARFDGKVLSVNYIPGANGHIEGTTSQSVAYATSTTNVTAVGNSGYVFVGWDDGSKEATRHEENVMRDMNITANFNYGWTVKFYNEGALFKTVTVEDGGTVQIQDVPLKAGYVFDRWDADLTSVTKDINTNALYLPKITIDPNGGTFTGTGIDAHIIGRGIKTGTLQYIVTESSAEPHTGMFGYSNDGLFNVLGNWIKATENYYKNSAVAVKEDSSSAISILTSRVAEKITLEYKISALSGSEMGITLNGERIVYPDKVSSEWQTYTAEGIEPIDGKIIIGVSYSQGPTTSGNDFAAIRNVNVDRQWVTIENDAYIWAPAVSETNYIHVKGVDDVDEVTVYKLVSNEFIVSAEQE